MGHPLGPAKVSEEALQSIGGRIRTAKSPRSPGRRNEFSFQSPGTRVSTLASPGTAHRDEREGTVDLTDEAELILGSVLFPPENR